MMDETATGVPLDSIAHIIQVALTPVFLLSGIGSLLNVITARLARVADQSDAVTEALRGAGAGEAAALYVRLLQQQKVAGGPTRRSSSCTMPVLSTAAGSST